MKDGTLVRFRTGKIVYKAYRDNAASTDWENRYTLVPENGLGRKRYRVRYTDLRQGWTSEEVVVNTSAGRVRRPKTFNRFPEYSGCTRRTHVGSGWVYKLEKYAGNGNRKNRVEAARYAIQTGMDHDKAVQRFGEDAVYSAERYRSVPIAECHLLPDGVLMMERVRPVYNLNEHEGADQLSREELEKMKYRRPDWAAYVDCDQIGYNRKGELVAFDL